MTMRPKVFYRDNDGVKHKLRFIKMPNQVYEFKIEGNEVILEETTYENYIKTSKQQSDRNQSQAN